jgi:hypothetical protein
MDVKRGLLLVEDEYRERVLEKSVGIGENEEQEN